MRVRRRGRRALGQPVSLDEQDVDGVEELRDLGRERCAPGDREPQPAAETFLHLLVDELVGEPVLGGEARWDGLAGTAQLAHAAADAERPVDELAARPRRFVEARHDRRMDLLVHPRHAREDGRLHRLQCRRGLERVG
jgi:hypothetical protein